MRLAMAAVRPLPQCRKYTKIVSLGTKLRKAGAQIKWTRNNRYVVSNMVHTKNWSPLNYFYATRAITWIIISTESGVKPILDQWHKKTYVQKLQLLLPTIAQGPECAQLQTTASDPGTKESCWTVDSLLDTSLLVQ